MVKTGILMDFCLNFDKIPLLYGRVVSSGSPKDISAPILRLR